MSCRVTRNPIFLGDDFPAETPFAAAMRPCALGAPDWDDDSAAWYDIRAEIRPPPGTTRTGARRYRSYYRTPAPGARRVPYEEWRTSTLSAEALRLLEAPLRSDEGFEE